MGVLAFTPMPWVEIRSGSQPDAFSHPDFFNEPALKLPLPLPRQECDDRRPSLQKTHYDFASGYR
jgi:hypothetical protein